MRRVHAVAGSDSGGGGAFLGVGSAREGTSKQDAMLPHISQEPREVMKLVGQPFFILHGSQKNMTPSYTVV